MEGKRLKVLGYKAINLFASLLLMRLYVIFSRRGMKNLPIAHPPFFDFLLLNFDFFPEVCSRANNMIIDLSHH